MIGVTQIGGEKRDTLKWILRNQRHSRSQILGQLKFAGKRFSFTIYRDLYKFGMLF